MNVKKNAGLKLQYNIFQLLHELAQLMHGHLTTILTLSKVNSFFIFLVIYSRDFWIGEIPPQLLVYSGDKRKLKPIERKKLRKEEISE